MASEVVSYHPISLTSCIVKLFERILTDGLCYIAESKHLFCHFQTGFRKGHKCEDQILQIVQAIEDGFKKGNQCSVLYWFCLISTKLGTLFGGKSYCYPCSMYSGYHHPLLCSFLNNQRAPVQLVNVLSSSRRFQQGLLQGSVLVPLLFLFYINNLTNKLCEEAVIAMLTDVVSILMTARTKVDAEHLAQTEVDIFSQWS